MYARLALVSALLLTLSMNPGLTRVSLTAVPLAQQTPSAGAASPPHDMMKMHEQMMADMSAGNAKLEALVAGMNSSTGAAKVDAIAAVVNELASQHRSMYGHMVGGCGMMMKH